MANMSSPEGRLLWLEAMVVALKKQADEADRKGSQALANQSQPSPGGGSGTTSGPFFYGYTTSSIAAISGNTLGTGSVKPCFPGGLVLTATGDADITVTNFTRLAISVVGTYVIYVRIGKVWAIIAANCGTSAQTAPATAPAAPTGLIGPMSDVLGTEGEDSLGTDDGSALGF